MRGFSIYELSRICETCPPLFRHLAEAPGPERLSVTEFKDRLASGLGSLDEDVLAVMSSVLPVGEYVPLLLGLWPRLVLPGEPGDYFAEERLAAFPDVEVWDRESQPSGPYYRGTTMYLRIPRALRVRPSSGCSVVTQPRTGSSLRDTHRGRIISDRACGIDIGWITRRRYGSARRPFPLEPGSLPPGRSPQDPGGRPAQSPAHADGLAIHDDGQGAVRDRSATGVRTRRPQMGRAGPPRLPLRRSRYTRLTAKTTPPQSSLQAPNPGEWSPGLGSAQPIAQRRPEGDLDAVAASWTTGSEEDGHEQLPADSG